MVVADTRASLLTLQEDLERDQVKTDLAKVLVQVDRLPQIDARLERLAGLFEREEREGQRKE